MADIEKSFFKKYDLSGEFRPKLSPVAHQHEALEELETWYREDRDEPDGGILVLPTGGGKTFTAQRFLCRHPLSEGYKLLWMAHTHHLLEQAFGELDEAVKAIQGGPKRFRARVVSGMNQHYSASRIEPGDDAVFATVQTIRSANRRGVPAFEEFVESADGKLVVVFDEAHHTPANTYRELLFDLRERNPEMKLLGMTATPTYTQEEKRGWLWELFPQKILYQATASNLMADGILAEPRVRQVSVDFEPNFDAGEYEKWVQTNRDLPSHVIDQLAESRERNASIADHYAEHQDTYGPTLMFADRWYQCVALQEALEERGVEAGSVFSKVNAKEAPEKVNQRTRKDNAKAIDAFKAGELDVLINIRMLTEGTDVPEAKTVFLTRKTRSRILLTQMIGRALRGPRFGGTDEAYVVSFVDDWQHLIHWAEFEELEGGLSKETPDYGERPPLELISIDLVRQLARQLDSGVNRNPLPYQEMLPAGWYLVEYVAAGSGDDIEQARELHVVYESQREGFETLIDGLSQEGGPGAFDMEAAEPGDQEAEAIQDATDALVEACFDDGGLMMSTVRPAVTAIARHMAQNGGERPTFFPFREREKHDLDRIAERLANEPITPIQQNRRLKKEYRRSDCFWDQIYPTYQHFKHAFDGAMNRALNPPNDGNGPEPEPPPEPPEPRVFEEPLRSEIIERDDRECLCCGYDDSRHLQVDHIRPYSFGGRTVRENGQTLCIHCNRAKNDRYINFRATSTSLEDAPERVRLDLNPPTRENAKEKEKWARFLRRVVNFFYECHATVDVQTGERGKALKEWEIELYSGLDPAWLEPHLEEMGRFARNRRAEAGYKAGPDRLTLRAPGQDPVKVELKGRAEEPVGEGR